MAPVSSTGGNVSGNTAGVPAGGEPGKGQVAWNNAKPYVGGAATVGGVFAAVYGAIMLFPKAVGNVLFPFLPEEFRPIAACSCSCSSCACVMVLAVVMLMKR